MRRFPAAVVLAVAACAAAGCATVSPDPPSAVPSAAATSAPAAADGADHLDGVREGPEVPPPPVHHVLGFTGPGPGAASRAAPSAPVAVRPAAPRRARGRGTVPDRTRPAGSAPPAHALPDVCTLGEAYGGWGGGSQAAHICRRAYGR
ncbi:hypothetical protein VSR01_35900 [Actinacidiphila sp. DG2A-62]|uniref:hypothetical protein n=1 Tax=Actinacidiphila sp. DG2A-62 TaxID=3108821 RepID=UPI002DC00AB9|nr:hypothetical protein [Actinacidiphila sp. DG2A-62]MEC3998583.1 hypothetical protein [Actinacidiphila sp. DG2A-62]